jgi:hypothetical protein
MAQIYAGSSNGFAYGMRNESQMPALEDLIKTWRSNCLFSDNAKVLIGKRIRGYSPFICHQRLPVRASLPTPKLCGTQDGDVKRTSSGIIGPHGDPCEDTGYSVSLCCLLLESHGFPMPGWYHLIEAATGIKGDILLS